jgi:hypothetical protein
VNDDDPRLFRGLLFALPPSLALWAVIFLAANAIRTH